MSLFSGAKLLEKLNIIIVSDHGMADMKNKTILVYNYVNQSLIDTSKTIYGIASNIYPINEQAVSLLFSFKF